MGKLQYGPNAAGVSLNLPDDRLIAISEVIRTRFLTGEKAGQPFKIAVTSKTGSPREELFVSSGVPLRISFDGDVDEEQITDEIRQSVKNMTDGLRDLDTLYISGFIEDQ